MAQGPPGWQNLPGDVRREIIGYLPDEAQGRMAQVSQQSYQDVTTVRYREAAQTLRPAVEQLIAAVQAFEAWRAQLPPLPEPASTDALVNRGWEEVQGFRVAQAALDSMREAMNYGPPDPQHLGNQGHQTYDHWWQQALQWEQYCEHIFD